MKKEREEEGGGRQTRQTPPDRPMREPPNAASATYPKRRPPLALTRLGSSPGASGSLRGLVLIAYTSDATPYVAALSSSPASGNRVRFDPQTPP